MVQAHASMPTAHSSRVVRNRSRSRSLAQYSRPSPRYLAIAFEAEARSVADIARARRCSVRTVQLAIQRVRRWTDQPAAPAGPVPRLVPFFGIGEFTPSSGCGHAPGAFNVPGSAQDPDRVSPFVCMSCHRSAWDAHPWMRVKTFPPLDVPAVVEPAVVEPTTCAAKQKSVARKAGNRKPFADRFGHWLPAAPIVR